MGFFRSLRTKNRKYGRMAAGALIISPLSPRAPASQAIVSGVNCLGHKKIYYVSRYLLYIIKRDSRNMDLFTSQPSKTNNNSNNILEQNWFLSSVRVISIVLTEQLGTI